MNKREIKEMLESLRCGGCLNGISCHDGCPYWVTHDDAEYGVAIGECVADRVAANKLESEIRAGTLLTLPVKMGGQLWLVVGRRMDNGRNIKMHHVQRSTLTWWNLPMVLKDYGRTYFKTQAEAEAALQKWREMSHKEPEKRDKM